MFSFIMQWRADRCFVIRLSGKEAETRTTTEAKPGEKRKKRKEEAVGREMGNGQMGYPIYR